MSPPKPSPPTGQHTAGLYPPPPPHTHTGRQAGCLAPPGPHLCEQHEGEVQHEAAHVALADAVAHLSTAEGTRAQQQGTRVRWQLGRVHIGADVKGLRYT